MCYPLLAVRSQAGQGTTITGRLPVHSQARAQAQLAVIAVIMFGRAGGRRGGRL